MRWILAGAGMAFMVGIASADTITISAMKDNTLYEDTFGELSNGMGQRFFAGTTVTGNIRRGLIAFDVASAVPAGSVIDSVSLVLHVAQAANTTSRAVTLHRVQRDWGEGASDAGGNEGSGAGAEAGDATWLNTFFPGEFWDTAGGDFDSATSATQFVAGVGFYTWTSDTMAAEVQGWLADPGSNFGWVVQNVESVVRTARAFDSAQADDRALRPTLTIEYTPVPAPGAAGVFAAAGLIAAGRRARRGVRPVGDV